MDNARPVNRPLINRPGPVPTLVRVPHDAGLFRGWGITL